MKEDPKSEELRPNQSETTKEKSLKDEEYEVSEYSSLCEDYSQIKKVIPLRKSKCKMAVFIILNICTVCIINLFITWFPKLNLFLKYSVTSIDKATHVGVYGVDGDLYISELEKAKFEDINQEEEQKKMALSMDST